MRRPSSLFPVLCCLALLAACRGGGAAPSVPGPAAPEWAALPPSALLYYDNSGGIQDSLRLVVRDAGAFRELWTRATSNQASPPPPPAVDFSGEMVLVVGAGRMTPEDLVRVDSVGVREETREGEGRREVLEAIVRTVRGCGGFASDAYPLAIVRVRRFDGEVRFVERGGRAEGCGVAAAPRLPAAGRGR